jgi:hypothetical protein
MHQDTPDERPAIDADMTLLDIVSSYRQTEAVFKQYDEKAGVCLCCQALFDPLKDVAQRYGLDLAELMADLKAVIEGNEEPAPKTPCPWDPEWRSHR